MTKSCFLSAGGDFFLSLFTIQLWQKYWHDEVDRMYVNYNVSLDEVHFKTEWVAEYLRRLSQDPKIHVIYHPHKIGWGKPIAEMTAIAEEDLIMLLEDDGFIFTPHFVESGFVQIEHGHVDAIGSPRRSCGTEIWDAMQKKYNLNYEGYGDIGPNYWPNFFFCKRKDLLATDMNFGSKVWQPGEYCKELDHTFVEKNSGDTFVWADIQMRYNGVQFGNIPQHHASPYEIDEEKTHMGNWLNGHPPQYLHGGSLSSGWAYDGFLLGGQGDVNADIGIQMELESRLAFWTIVSDEVSGFDEYKAMYKQGIENLIRKGLNRGRINKKIELYRRVMHL